MNQTLHIFLFHGLGAQGDDLAPVGRLLAEQANLASGTYKIHTPEAPSVPVTVNNGYVMPSWFDIYGLDRTAPVDEAGIHAAVDKMTRLIEQRIGDQPFVIGGFSQGGVVALRTAMATARPPLGVLLLSTWLPDRTSFAVPADRLTLPVFIGHGTQDDVVPHMSADSTAAHLRALGMTAITQHSYAMAHSIIPDELADMADWLSNLSATASV
jgi:phospholipase/carboxylesterase